MLFLSGEAPTPPPHSVYPLLTVFKPVVCIQPGLPGRFPARRPVVVRLRVVLVVERVQVPHRRLLSFGTARGAPPVAPTTPTRPSTPPPCRSPRAARRPSW